MRISYQKGVISLSLLFVLLFCNKAGSSQMLHPKIDNQLVAKDAAWCWFSDPRAVYYKGKFNKIYYGYINSRGDVVIGSRDEDTKEIQTFILHKNLQIDDHNVPSILFLPDGKILTFYTEHNGRFFMRKSKVAEDVSEWEEEKVLSFGLKNQLICYSHPVMLSAENNRIYMFFRSRNKRLPDDPEYVDWRQNYSYSDDLGMTWTDAQYYLNSKGDYNKIPYLKLVSDNKSKIHFLFTDGHPKLGFSSVYHAYYEKGKFHQTNEGVISVSNNLPLNIDKVNKVYDSEERKIKSWIWDIALDKRGIPVVAYAQYPSITDHVYHVAYWDGKQWIDKEIINSGKYITSPEKTAKVLEEHYSGGVVLDHNNPNNVFLSRQINGIFEIEHWKLSGKGWITKAVTHNSNSNNVRPYVIDNFKGKHPIVMWMNGVYEHYIRYHTNLFINKK